MQIQCYHCHKPFALSKEAVYAGLEQVTSQNLSHYNAYCPHCRRANRISAEELKHAAPNWTPQTGQETPDE